MPKIKLIVTESQMRYIISENRLETIKQNFKILSNEESEKLSKKDLSKIKSKKSGDAEQDKKEQIVKPLFNHDRVLLAIYLLEKSEVMNPITNQVESRIKYKEVRPTEYVFNNIVNADPSTNKMYVQWMLNIFIKLIKDGDEEEAIRFVDEDLPQASEYIETFDNVKNTRLFKEVSSNIEGLPNNPGNINEYKSLSQLFKAVESFVEREGGELETAVNKFVKAGQADILYQDSKWVVYNPLTRDANCVIGNISEICTAREENSMFDNYTRSYKEPSGNPSKIYVILPKETLRGESNEVYQFHFETDQFRNRTQTDAQGRRGNMDWVTFLDMNPGLRNFFVSRITPLAIERGGNLRENKYLQQLMSMGEVDNVFDYFDDNLKIINLDGFKIKRLPDQLGKFKNAEQITLNELGLVEIPKSVGDMTNLQFFLAKNNSITELPESISKLKNLNIINVVGNPIKKIPKSISKLSPSKGGSLFRVNIGLNSIDPKLVEELKKLLPDVNIT